MVIVLYDMVCFLAILTLNNLRMQLGTMRKYTVWTRHEVCIIAQGLKSNPCSRQSIVTMACINRPCATNSIILCLTTFDWELLPGCEKTFAIVSRGTEPVLQQHLLNRHFVILDFSFYVSTALF